MKLGLTEELLSMHKRASGHVQMLVWILVLFGLLGLALEQLAWSFVLGLTVYLFWSLRQTIRLHQWLFQHYSGEDIPQSHGLWGDLFDGLYRLQKRNQETENQLKAMIKRIRTSTNALKDAVIMTNAYGQMDWWNDAACRLFGFRRDKDQGQLFTNLLRDPAFKRYFDNKNYDEALKIQSPYDPNILLRLHITLFGEEDRLILAQDITRVQQLEQMRRDFVSNVSHEMRTPLTVIKGYVETLQDADDSPKKWARALTSMGDQTQRLDLLVSDLLLLEKYESQDAEDVSRTVAVKALLETICHDATLFSGEQKHQITLCCEVGDDLIGEESQLRSAFSNLVFNAVKYTPANGDINVRWYRNSRGVHLSVEDNGCGFDPIHIPRLTERFYRADPSRNKNTGGSGLGLAIVKHVLINHNGSLEIHSRMDQGSEFICHFPLSQIATS